MEESAAAEGFDRFFVSASRRLLAQAFLLTGDLGEAEDLAQETLARAWRHWDRLSGFEDPDGWARRVLHNLAVSRWRRRRTARQAAARLVAPLPALPLDEAQLDLVAALRRLPLQQSRALVLRAVAGLDVEQIAAEMGAAPGTVRVWLSRARAAMVVSLAGDDATDGGRAGGVKGGQSGEPRR